MSTGMVPAARGRGADDGVCEPGAGEVARTLALAAAFVVLTRLPVARTEPFDSDEQGFLQTIRAFDFPPHHTLFLAAGKLCGRLVGDPYLGLVALDMLVSALALGACWWWLRALVRPATALAATLVLGVAPIFWAYGAMAGNYTMIPLVGAFLLGVAARGVSRPEPWHPFAAALVLAVGTGYRQDIGTYWLPVFFVILWQHRWMAAAQAAAVFTIANLAWLGAMLRDVGGWDSYQALTRDFVYHAGYLNSVWNLGPVDATARYALKAAMALAWTFGPGLLFVPIGLGRLAGSRPGRRLALLLGLSVAPALGMHLTVHFGVPGYAFHYVPATLALLAIGIGGAAGEGEAVRDRSPARLAVLGGLMALVFLIYPTRYDPPGLRSDFDLAFARHTRVGLRTRAPLREPSTWRTSNSPSSRRARSAGRPDPGRLMAN